MIEKIILDYLISKKLNVFMEQPKVKPESFYLIQKTAGGETNKVRTSTIAIQSYAESLYNASLMNEIVIDTMLEMGELDGISRVELNSNYNFTDPTTKQYRYQAVFVVTHY